MQVVFDICTGRACRADLALVALMTTPRGLRRMSPLREHYPHVSWIKAVVGILVACIGVIAGIVAVLDFIEHRTALELSGGWRVENTIASTSYTPFRGLRLGYRMLLIQSGTNLNGEGEK